MTVMHFFNDLDGSTWTFFIEIRMTYNIVSFEGYTIFHHSTTKVSMAQHLNILKDFRGTKPSKKTVHAAHIDFLNCIINSKLLIHTIL